MEKAAKEFIDNNIENTIQEMEFLEENPDTFLHRISSINKRIRTKPDDY